MTPLEDGSTREPQPDAHPEVTQGAPAEPVAPPLALVEEDEEPRRYPSTLGGMIYLLVLAVMFAALLVVALGHWRGGVHILAGSLVAAAIPRALLKERDAGMLGVRGRWFDVALLVSVGAAMWFLATTIPAQG
ncbi:DUF3017 domain-containing protein [Nocardioides nematodiphilus]|uniref:DUF3017 domain-containing protein n=1 Tax=Nocardioides nematodiphilus TaxID=2849669 RepID=UPI001CDA46FB|nr:DUF3017 domain-containing protein [Nocardioides nematodiphilus]MCA1983489.1 DUF3017 domain-containing protein [Nocardioides nematodiphilus]